MQYSFFETHRELLKQTTDETLLYKVTSFENFLKMLEGNYLHFNRVDKYTDDKNDADQPNQERLLNQKIYFEKNPNFSVENYYEECRKRSYACCFSLDIPKANQWKDYGGDDPTKAVCLVMNFGKLKFLLNETFRSSRLVTNTGIILNNHSVGKNLFDNITQILHLNYGIINYGDFVNDVISTKVRPNPIEYLYFKDNSYREKDGRELRISLSSIGMGKIRLTDGQLFEFPESIAFEFNLNQALSCGAISHIEIADKNFLPEFLNIMKDKKIVLEN